MLTGSCLCGTVRYRIDGRVDGASHCHCSQCRKAHGAAFATYGHVRYADFQVTAGAAAIARYQASPRATRTFCRRCGSNLQWCPTGNAQYFALALGTLDDDPGVRPERHIFIGSKAPWYTIEDDLPQFAQYPAADQG
jgi:hypothetical protein